MAHSSSKVHNEVHEDKKWSRINMFVERKTKAKMTVFAIVLLTVAFYATIIFKLPLDYFIYYSIFISLADGTMKGADVLNTLSFNKAKNAKPKSALQRGGS